MIVIVHGPQACGKTRHADKLLRHFRCYRLVDDWDGSAHLKDGDLALTNLVPPFKVHGAKVVDFATAKHAVTERKAS